MSIAIVVYAPQYLVTVGFSPTAAYITAGAVSGAVSSGTLQGAFMGGISAGLFGGLHGWDVAGAGFWESAAKVAAHGMVGGVMSELGGGDFQSGFFASAFTQTASQMGAFNNLGDPKTISGRTQNAIAAAVLGGTASVIGGGKFSNGALTGAFSRLFNDIRITINRDTYSSNSVTGRINVSSDKVSDTFSGYTLEDRNAGLYGDKSPIPAGEYPASVRSDHTPNRVELRGVVGYENIQIHTGNTVDDVMGCFAVGTTRTTDFVGGSRNAMDRILNVIRTDGTGRISVEVIGSSKPR